MFAVKSSDFLKFFYQAKCLACNGEVCSYHSLCPDCWNKIELSGTKTPLLDDTKVKSFAVYCPIISRIISDFKYKDKLENLTLLCKFLYLACADFSEDANVIAPVPMHYEDFFARRYNPIGLLANKLGILTKKRVDYNLLIKTKKTKKQVGLDKQERVKNLSGAFSINIKESLKGKRVLLIDDVATTGSTLRECAKSILLSGAEKIYAVTIGTTTQE